MSDQIKVFIATPMYGGMCTGFYTQSLLMMQQVFGQNNIHSAISFVFNESLIQRARNSLAHAFLKTDCTHLLFIDADLRFDGAGVYKMIESDKDIICGIYPKKEIEKLKEVTPTYCNDMVDLAGSIKDKERIYNFFSISIEEGTERLLSEDYFFCLEWRKIGGKVYAAPWMTPGHIGTYIFEGHLPQEDQPQ